MATQQLVVASLSEAVTRRDQFVQELPEDDQRRVAAELYVVYLDQIRRKQTLYSMERRTDDWYAQMCALDNEHMDFHDRIHELCELIDADPRSALSAAWWARFDVVHPDGHELVVAP